MLNFHELQSFGMHVNSGSYLLGSVSDYKEPKDEQGLTNFQLNRDK